jgi:hypothetical protein
MYINNNVFIIVSADELLLSTYDDIENRIKMMDQYNNISKAYPNGGGLTGQTVRQGKKYNNKGNIFHNNIGENILYDKIYTNRIIIDSNFSDHHIHKDPFRFTVKFNGTEAVTTDINVDVEGKIFGYKKYINGDTCVVIDRIFKNVTNVIIDALILPSQIEFITDVDGKIKPSGQKLSKVSNKYLALKINELSNGRFITNKKSFGSEAIVMKNDDEHCIKCHRWIPMNDNIEYIEPNSKNIDRLTVEICDSNGQKLETTLDGKAYDFFGEYKKIIDNVVKNEEIDDETYEKLTILKNIIENLYPELHITICTYEGHINTLFR